MSRSENGIGGNMDLGARAVEHAAIYLHQQDQKYCLGSLVDYKTNRHVDEKGSLRPPRFYPIPGYHPQASQIQPYIQV